MSQRGERVDTGGLIVGEHPTIERLRSTIERIAPTALPVLIQGPTGSGKELVAQALHARSGRPGLLVAFNVCAITESMFEDALFGHVRGAFTGAATDAPGYLLEADGGTAFFDEIGSLPLASQSKLLRAVETREFRPVGGRRDRFSDFRMITATNEPLSELVVSGRFRRDLAHRLGGLILTVPSLRERQTDIPLLVTHFIDRARAVDMRWEVSEGALDALVAHEWPGNVRELSYVVDRMLFSSTSPRITRAIALEALGSTRSDAPEVDTFERRRLMALLAEHDWDKSKVASRLGVSRATMYRRLKRAAITMPADMPEGTTERPEPDDGGVRVGARLPVAPSESPTRA